MTGDVIFPDASPHSEPFSNTTPSTDNITFSRADE
jgi:hypothetical protein